MWIGKEQPISDGVMPTQKRPENMAEDGVRRTQIGPKKTAGGTALLIRIGIPKKKGYVRACRFLLDHAPMYVSVAAGCRVKLRSHWITATIPSSSVGGFAVHVI